MAKLDSGAAIGDLFEAVRDISAAEALQHDPEAGILDTEWTMEITRQIYADRYRALLSVENDNYLSMNVFEFREKMNGFNDVLREMPGFAHEAIRADADFAEVTFSFDRIDQWSRTQQEAHAAFAHIVEKLKADETLIADISHSQAQPGRVVLTIRNAHPFANPIEPGPGTPVSGMIDRFAA